MKAKANVKQTSSGLAFEGLIDHQSIPALIAQLSSIEAKEPVLDLAGVSYIDSAGLAFLISWGHQNLKAGQKISLSGASTQAQQLIETMKLGMIFEIKSPA